MGSLVPTKKLDRSNYICWSYKMHQYLLGHGYWSYLEGENDASPNSTPSFPSLEIGGKQSSVLLQIYCEQPAIEPHPGHQNVKGCLGKSEELFLLQARNTESSSLDRSSAKSNRETCRWLITPPRSRRYVTP